MSVDDLITSLEQAKRKLTAAKGHGYTAVRTIGRARDQVGVALGRSGQNSALVARMSAKERAALAEVRRLDALIAQLDQSIAQAREIGRDGPIGRGGAP